MPLRLEMIPRWRHMHMIQDVSLVVSRHLEITTSGEQFEDCSILGPFPTLISRR
jgi:hypothetical protein